MIKHEMPKMQQDIEKKSPVAGMLRMHQDSIPWDMIKINKINDITFVNAAVTDFSDSLGYCEYKIPLSIQGAKPKPILPLGTLIG